MKKLTKFLTIVGTTLYTFFSYSQTTFATVTNPVIGDLGKPSGKGKEGTVFIGYAVSLWRAAITLGALMVIFMYIWGGIDWISAAGDSGKLEKARNKIIQGTIGLIILASSFTLVGFVGSLLFGKNFSIINITFPTP